ncbi:MAG: 5-methylthioadenosine/S-adenosylhomocysteine deaminase [Thermomicrobiales bacterium]|nr:5-methylthioadenosine/S-adenosylhomocysteine deaminase [Thermomicrobiales bacterium]
MYDLLIRGGHLLTMTGDGVGFVENGAVAINGRRIVAVGPRESIEANDRARQTIDATNRLVMPGLIDAHVHSAATIARGLAQEVETWMGSAYGPLMRHAVDDDAPLWTTLALMEGIAAGTTTFGDYEYPMEHLVQTHVRMGNRAVVCQGVSEVDWSQRERWQEQGWRPGEPALLDPAVGERGLEGEIALFERWHDHDGGRISVVFGPIAADMVSEALLLRCQDEARKRGTLIHLHVAQDPRENNATLRRAGLRAIPYLDSIGLLAPETIAVHLSTATPDEVRLVAEKSGRMACCSNSIGIIDGVVPPAGLFRDSGGAVALGSDQAAGNNSHNVFAEMRATAMFAKIAAGSPLPLPAWQVLRMATIDGARVLGIEDRVGSLEEGKEADLILLDLTRPPLAPVVMRPARNLVPNLVYAETGANVRLTMVAGRVIYQDGAFANVDHASLIDDVAAATARFEAAAEADPAVESLPIVELSRAGKI